MRGLWDTLRIRSGQGLKPCPFKTRAWATRSFRQSLRQHPRYVFAHNEADVVLRHALLQQRLRDQDESADPARQRQ
jgi:hypothetical protein